MNAQPPPDIPEIIDGHRVLGLLGQGGMGRVLIVERLGDGRRLAMKLLLPSAPLELIERFEREAEAQARVADHPHVVAVHAFGRAAAGPWMTLELVEGGSLADRLRRGPLSEDELRALLQDIGAALDHLHEQGVIHRDLKPANILCDADGRRRLADFGLARLLDAESLSRTGEVLGTPAYMAPEQIEGGKAAISPATDVYGLGAVLCHAATGRPPFEGKSSFALMNAVLTTAPPPIADQRPDLSPALCALIERALEKDPADRFPTARVMAQALTPCAAPPPLRRRTVRRLIVAQLIFAGLVGFVALFARLYPGTLAVRRFDITLDGGAEVFRDGETVAIAGRVTGPTRVLDFRIHGRPVPVAPDGRFEHELPLHSSAIASLMLEARGYLCAGSRVVRVVADDEAPRFSVQLSHRLDRMAEGPEPSPVTTVPRRDGARPLEVVSPTPRLVVTATDRSAELTLVIEDADAGPAHADRHIGKASLRGAGERRHVMTLDVPAAEDFRLRITVSDRSGRSTTGYLRLARLPTIQEILKPPPDAKEIVLSSQTAIDRISRSSSEVLVPAGTVVRVERVVGTISRRLIIAGTPDQRVRFVTGPDGWGGFEIQRPWPEGPVEVLLAYCDVVGTRSESRRLVDGARANSSSGSAFNLAGVSRFEASHCTFTDCHALDAGGAIYVSGRGLQRGHVRLRSCRFERCRAQTKAGALLIAGGTDATIEDCVFRSNLGGRGGAVGVLGSDSIEGNRIARATIQRCLFEGNRSVGDTRDRKCHGGGLSVERNGRARILDCRFVENSSTAAGGAIGVRNSSYLGSARSPARFDDKLGHDRTGIEVARSEFSANQAPRGTTLYALGNVSLELRELVIKGDAGRAVDPLAPSGVPSLVQFDGITAREITLMEERLLKASRSDKPSDRTSEPPAGDPAVIPQLHAVLEDLRLEQPAGAPARRALTFGSHCLITASALRIVGFQAPDGAAIYARSIIARPTHWILRQCVIERCRSSSSRPTVALHGAARVRIESCEFVGLSPPGLLVTRSMDRPKQGRRKLWGATEVRVSGCKFRDAGPALQLIGPMTVEGDPGADNTFAGPNGYRRVEVVAEEGRGER